MVFILNLCNNLKFIYISVINFLIFIFLLGFLLNEKVKEYVYLFDKDYLNSNINYYSNNKNKIFGSIIYDFISYKSQFEDKTLESFEQKFDYDQIYNFSKYKKIIIVILESAPLFKYNELNNYLYEQILNENHYSLSKFHVISDLNLSTIGAEAKFVCDQSNVNYSNIINKPIEEFEHFYSECEIVNYFLDNNFLVNYFHGFDKTFYSRNLRYKNFDNLFFLEDVLKSNPLILNTRNKLSFNGVDDIEMIKFSFNKIDSLSSSYNIITTLGTHDEFIYYDKSFCDNSKNRIIKKDIFFCKMFSTYRAIISQIIYEFDNLSNRDNLLIITSDHPPKNLLKKYNNFIYREKVPLLIISND